MVGCNMKQRALIRDAMLFAVKDITGRVLREETVETMVDDFIVEMKNNSKTNTHD